MQVSVVCCAYDETMYNSFCDTADSALAQTHLNVEVVVDESTRPLYERSKEAYDYCRVVVIHCNDEYRRLVACGNIGRELTRDDVVVFVDIVAVRGKVVPEWVSGCLRHILDAFFWLVGVPHWGLADGPGEVRNANASNLFSRREMVSDLGKFDKLLSRQGGNQIQIEKMEFCARREIGQRIWYSLDAEIAHKLFDYRTSLQFLFRRAFWQEYTKHVVERLVSEVGSVKQDLFGRLPGAFLLGRLRHLVRSASIEYASQIVMLLTLTGTVWREFLYGGAR